MASLARKLLVVGGTGGVGLQVCKLAVARGWDVSSLSRRGTPSRLDADSKTSTAWMDKVNWAKGDSLQPSTYQDLIKDTDAVVHTVGLLLEADYKEIMHSQSVQELLTAVQKATRSTNPLERAQQPKQNGSSAGTSSDLTYEKVNRDTAITVAKEAEKAGTEAFVFISAAFAPPLVPQRYLTTKRQVEDYLLSHMVQPAASQDSSPSSEPSATTAADSKSDSNNNSNNNSGSQQQQKKQKYHLRPIILRPAFMSTAERPATMPLAGLLHVSSAVLGKAIRGTVPLAQYVSTPPLAMETVAQAVMNGIENSKVCGIVDVEGIETLARNPTTAAADNVGATKWCV
ncbi:hypothetical protein DFQ26_000462 [Actinomortierella ambigua]|nr:hypothetical protein DFQ26_000462 [Actinomortierella ambigua]